LSTTLPPLPSPSSKPSSAVADSIGKPISDTLDERGKRYGLFTGHAMLSQHLKGVMHTSPKWRDLAADQREALEMIQHKVARILNGDPDHHDSWHDIAGYATLVADRLAGRPR
jgi:hypothetical protein